MNQTQNEFKIEKKLKQKAYKYWFNSSVTD